MDQEYWETQYRKVQKPDLPPVLTGFNVILDRIIPVTANLLDPSGFCHGTLENVRSRLVRSMERCTAEEWYFDDPALYARLISCFAGAGTIALGGQAGISAAHLARLGAPDVLCIAPVIGPESARLLTERGVRVAGSGSSPPADTVHHIFEYAPGLVPLAQGAIPRNNRFIVSPAKTAQGTLLPEAALAGLLPRLKNGTRAFLSGYQYLHTGEEFLRAAAQMRAIRDAGRDIRVHVECVSVTDRQVNAGIVHHILPAADSAGMNENELSLLLGHPVAPGPAGLADGVFELAEATGLARIHLHMYGCYLLAVREDRAVPDASRNALCYAARVTAEAACGTGMALSPQGMGAVDRLADVLGDGEAPGMWHTRGYILQAVPTIITTGIRKTTGLGDILSSTAFVADRF